MKVSIKVISQQTGFSPSTVSNALNHKRGVNKETAEIIFQTAESMGYQMNSKIEKIRFVTYRKNGKIVDDTLFFPAMIEGVERQAKQLGYETIFTKIDCQDAACETQLQMVLEDRSAGLIVLGTEMDEEDFEKFRSYSGALVFLDGWSDRADFDGVLINNMDSAYQAVQYLIDSGHEKIGYLRGDERIRGFCERECGYQKALQGQNLKAEPEYVITLGTKMDTAYKDMKRYLESGAILPTAFFADNDVIAIGAMRALQEKNISIPQRVSVVGFDGIQFSNIFVPGLTTEHVFKHEMGEIAVRRIAEKIENPQEAIRQKIRVCTRLLERNSVKRIKKQ